MGETQKIQFELESFELTALESYFTSKSNVMRSPLIIMKKKLKIEYLDP